MKKILLSSVLVLSMILDVAPSTFAADYYAVGVDAFKKNSYDKATLNLEHAVRINPKNVNARYYLAQAYLVQKRVADAKDQYQRIIVLAPTSDAAILSQKGLSLIKQANSKNAAITSLDELAMYKDNYFDYVVTSNGEIKKWAAFPLNIYIEPQKHSSAVKKAFEQWQEKSKKLVSFNFVDSPDKAKIGVYFKDKLETTSTEKGFIAGYSKPSCEGMHISKSDIQLLTKDPKSGDEFDDNFISSVALHEIGHSLGFVGHSPKETDVMSASSSDPKTELTVRDINTLNVFYRIDQKTLLARSSGSTDVKLQQALDYVKSYPEKSVGWANLGDIYNGKKMYSEAVKNYQKAINLEPDKANLYGLIGMAYRSKGEKESAYLNFKKAYELESTNESYLTAVVASAIAIGKKSEAKSYVDSYIAKNPQNANKASIQKLVSACQ